MFWKKYSKSLFIILFILIIISVIIIYQLLFNVQTVTISQAGNSTTVNLYSTNGMIQYVFPLIYVIVGIFTTFLINDIKSVKNEEKVVSVLRAALESNSKILKYNKNRVELELRMRETTDIPLKLFKSDFWDLLNYNPPKRLIDEKLYLKIGNSAIIMNSINEINQIKEYHKANDAKKRDPKFRSFNDILRKEINELDSLLKEMSNSLN